MASLILVDLDVEQCLENIRKKLKMSYFDGVRGETVGSLSLLASQGDLEKLQEVLSSDGGRERWRAADNRG